MGWHNKRPENLDDKALCMPPIRGIPLLTTEAVWKVWGGVSDPCSGMGECAGGNLAPLLDT
eukprot:1159113-Pelagomonas_calceolata.AAC.17